MDSASPGRRPILPVLLAVLMVVPLIIGAVLVGTGTVDFRGSGADAGASAEAGQSSGGSDARGQAQTSLRDAAAESSLLVTGLDQGSGSLGEMHDGVGELVDGLAELQEGTSQLSAATEQLSAGLDGATGGLPLLAAAVGQINGSIDRARDSLLSSDDPGAQAAIEDLDSLQRQLNGLDFGDMSEELETAAEGARRISSESGNALSDGVGEASDGVEQLRDAVGEVQEGLDRLQGAAASTNEHITDAQVALAGTAVDSADIDDLATDTAPDRSAEQQLTILFFFVMAAAAMLGFRAAPDIRPTVKALGAVVAVGSVVMLSTTPGFSVLSAFLAVLMIAVVAVASAAATAVIRKGLGRNRAAVMLPALLLIQVVYLGFFWRSTSSGVVDTVAALMPLTYPADGIASLLPDVSATYLPFTFGIAVLGGIGLLAVAALWVSRRGGSLRGAGADVGKQAVLVGGNDTEPAESEDGTADRENDQHDESDGSDAEAGKAD